MGDDNNNNNGPKYSAWYSLALGGCVESIHTAHERDRSQLQEEIRGLVVPSALRGNGNSTGFASSIFVSEKLQQRIKEKGGLKRSMEDDDFSSDLMPSKAAFVRPVKKTATSAKNFFGASGKTASATTKTKSKPIPSDKKSMSKSKPAKSSVLSFQPKSRDSSSQSSKSASNNKQKQQGSRDAEKENVLNKSSKAVGNADDFLGDMDDEDNDSDSVDEVDESGSDSITQTKTNEKNAVAAESPKKIARRAYQMDGSDSDKDVEQPVEDDAVEKAAKVNATSNDGAKHKRRRKTLVEKTFTDENGYLYTETQTIWEDVPSDEEDASVLTNKKSTGAAPGKKAQKVSGPPKAMKQGSLMGFFTKK